MKTKIGPQTMIFPMPALLIGSYAADGTPNAMTAAWSAVCCLKPVSVGAAIRHNRFTLANIKEKKAFTINVPKTSQAKEVDYLGTVSGAKKPDKLVIAGLESTRGERVDAPILTACPVNLECQITQLLDLGSHTWCVGEVLEVHVDQELVRENNVLDIEALDPLVYITSVSSYYTLGEPVGKAYQLGKSIKDNT